MSKRKSNNNKKRIIIIKKAERLFSFIQQLSLQNKQNAKKKSKKIANLKFKNYLYKSQNAIKLKQKFLCLTITKNVGFYIKSNKYNNYDKRRQKVLKFFYFYKNKFFEKVVEYSLNIF